ncbi:hypothetical protein [Streptomyces sp. 8N706]|uniref:hypothetical protein n=1 Tax=Streptomyces sp. 8N706 TaxID=3457416 RepID=UPI003FD6B768
MTHHGRRGLPRLPGPLRATGRRARVAALAALLTAVAGCGIRGTSVPVDAGAAPSRASCQVAGDSNDVADSPKTGPIKVYLVCSTQILPVDRQVRLPEGRPGTDRLGVARAVLGELQHQPGRPEEEAGFSTEVPSALQVTGPRKGDRKDALRLNRVPDDLPPYARAQLVCTFAETLVSASAAAGNEPSVVLGGPPGDSLERYTCTERLRNRPEAAQADGTPVD